MLRHSPLTLVCALLEHLIAVKRAEHCRACGRESRTSAHRQQQIYSVPFLLFRRVGELIGGSQREDRMDVLSRRMIETGLNPDDYWWYMDLRRYGSVPHAGFGLGFERLVQFSTGVENIRDVIPFPRFPNHCKF